MRHVTDTNYRKGSLCPNKKKSCKTKKGKLFDSRDRQLGKISSARGHATPSRQQDMRQHKHDVSEKYIHQNFKMRFFIFIWMFRNRK